ncbi:hypothetical protein SIN8267_03156 [Sinobacterium norvegicum]|uniref:Uncharacterized protein n=1 Tax=Sinobacterium norvegicum TaxID=1641715 RepID=A0ABN8EL01_9GAMM|nr:LysE family translocator [Sinobacterium norvegicum]CAH0993017.1 hypothetical protein SIN8267_03156 [Sinobacterium norvegicum]
MLDLTTITTLLAAASFSFAASVSPGINTLMLANCGANHGFSRTIPMLLGCNIGLCLMLILVAFGAGQLFVLFPWLDRALLYFCTAYLLYLCIQLLKTSKPQTEEGTSTSPIGFLQATSIQVINPGIWMLAVAAMGFTTQIDSGSTMAAIIICAVITAVNLPAIAIWAVSGSAIKKWLHCPLKLKTFNTVLSLLTFATIPMLWLNIH